MDPLAWTQLHTQSKKLKAVRSAQAVAPDSLVSSTASPHHQTFQPETQSLQVDLQRRKGHQICNNSQQCNTLLTSTVHFLPTDTLHMGPISPTLSETTYYLFPCLVKRTQKHTDRGVATWCVAGQKRKGHQPNRHPENRKNRPFVYSLVITG